MVTTDNTEARGDRAAQMVFFAVCGKGFEQGEERMKLLVGESAMYAICLPYASYLVTHVPDWLTGMRCGTARAHCMHVMGMVHVYVCNCAEACALVPMPPEVS